MEEESRCSQSVHRRLSSLLIIIIRERDVSWLHHPTSNLFWLRAIINRSTVTQLKERSRMPVERLASLWITSDTNSTDRTTEKEREKDEGNVLSLGIDRCCYFPNALDLVGAESDVKWFHSRRSCWLASCSIWHPLQLDQKQSKGIINIQHRQRRMQSSMSLSDGHFFLDERISFFTDGKDSNLNETQRKNEKDKCLDGRIQFHLLFFWWNPLTDVIDTPSMFLSNWSEMINVHSNEKTNLIESISFPTHRQRRLNTRLMREQWTGRKEEEDGWKQLIHPIGE